MAGQLRPAAGTQETAGRNREIHLERIEAATARLAEAEEALRDDAEIRIDLPGTAVPTGRIVLTMTGLDGEWHPARTGPAGESLPPPTPSYASSKTTCSRRCPRRSG